MVHSRLPALPPDSLDNSARLAVHGATLPMLYMLTLLL